MKPFLLAAMSLLLILGVYRRLTADVDLEKSVQDKVDYVDEKIEELITCDLYREGSLEEREKMSSMMLSQLKKEGYIAHLSYSSTDGLFSFQYADGTLGGIKIEDFNSNPSDLPIN